MTDILKVQTCNLYQVNRHQHCYLPSIQYAGGYFDSATNLYKFGARYYNAADARWTQLDPSGQDFGYLYAGNDPVNFVDPSGLVTAAALSQGCIAVMTTATTIGLGVIALGGAVGAASTVIGGCVSGAGYAYLDSVYGEGSTNGLQVIDDSLTIWRYLRR